MADPQPARTTSTSPFTRRLRELHDIKHPPGGKRPSMKALAAAITRASGVTISSGYVGRLLKGEQDNPSREVLGALAAYYGVHLGYFDEADDEAKRTQAQLELAMALDDAGIRRLVVTVRDAGLSAAQLRQLTEIARILGQMEDLPDIPPAED